MYKYVNKPIRMGGFLWVILGNSGYLNGKLDARYPEDVLWAILNGFGHQMSPLRTFRGYCYFNSVIGIAITSYSFLG